jgi:hypothetical protein
MRSRLVDGLMDRLQLEKATMSASMLLYSTSMATVLK